MRKYLKIGLLLCFANGLFAQSVNVDSLIRTVHNLPENAEKLNLTIAIADHLNWEDKERARPFIYQALAMAKSLKDYKALGDALHLVFEYSRLSKDSSFLVLNQANEAYIKANYLTGQARVLLNKALTVRALGQLDSAMNYMFESQKIYEKVGNDFKVNSNFIGIANIFDKMKRYEKAAEYLKKAEAYISTTDDQYLVAYYYLNTAKNKFKLDKIKEGIADYKFVFELAQKHGIRSDIITSGIRLGDYYIKNGFLKEAKFYYDTALENSIKMKAAHYTAEARSGRGKYFLALGNYEQALIEFEQAELFAKHHDSQFFKNELNQNLAKVHAGLAHYEQAYQYSNRYAAIQDTIFLEETIQIASTTEAIYQNQKKEAQLQQKEREQQQLYMILGLFLLAGLAMLWAFSQKNKANKLLQEKNEEKEFLIKEIHHRVKNNLQIISSLLNLQTSAIEDTNAKHAVIEGRNRVQSMSLIHQKLYMGDNVASIDMKSYIADLAHHLLTSFGKDNGEITIQSIINLPPLDVDSAIPLGLIINELLTNSLKYAFNSKEFGKIAIQLYIDVNNNMHLVIEDDGEGMQENTTSGTKFGTKIVQILSKKLKGKVQQISSETGYQTHIVFSRYRLGIAN